MRTKSRGSSGAGAQRARHQLMAVSEDFCFSVGLSAGGCRARYHSWPRAEGARETCNSLDEMYCTQELSSRDLGRFLALS